jgi:hypothetical protein
LNQAINHASEIVLASLANFLKTVEALKILDQLEKNYYCNFLFITEARK